MEVKIGSDFTRPTVVENSLGGCEIRQSRALGGTARGRQYIFGSARNMIDGSFPGPLLLVSVWLAAPLYRNVLEINQRTEILMTMLFMNTF